MCMGFYVYFHGFPHLSRSAIIIFTLISAYLTLFTLIQAKWVAYSISSLALIVYLTNFHYHGNKSDTLLMVSGVITGFAILAKLNCGGYVLCAIGLGLLNDLLIYQSEQNKVSWHKTKRLIYFCLPAIACLGLYLISNFNHLSELIDQVIVFPSQRLEQHRIISLAYRNDSPYELFKDFVPIYLTVVFPLIWFHLQLVRVAKTLKLRQFLPLALGIIILPLLLIAELQYPNLLPKFFVLPLTGVIACQLFVQPIKTPQFTMISGYSLFLHYYLSRSDDAHYSPLVFFVVVLVLTEILNYWQQKSFKRYFYSLLMLIAYSQLRVPWQTINSQFIELDKIANSGQVFQLGDLFLAKNDADYLMSAELPLSPPQAKLYHDQQELAALQFVHQHTTKNDYVYIGVTDHANVYISQIKPYWKLGRKIGVKNYVLEPGLTTEEPIQAKMIAQLQENNVDWVILWEQPEAEIDFRQRNYVGSDLLDRYIEQNYSLVKQIGTYWIYSRETVL